jgi:hypothetical protein
MTKTETARAYLIEPILSALVLWLLINRLGDTSNAAFMRDEARDILSLYVVLLGAALALWIGLFWISSSEFGQWLASRQMLGPINTAYVASTAVLLTSCILCIFCAHAPASQTWLQFAGEFFSLWGIATMYTLLNNTRLLLKLHGLYGERPKPVTKIGSPQGEDQAAMEKPSPYPKKEDRRPELGANAPPAVRQTPHEAPPERAIRKPV